MNPREQQGKEMLRKAREWMVQGEIGMITYWADRRKCPPSPRLYCGPKPENAFGKALSDYETQLALEESFKGPLATPPFTSPAEIRRRLGNHVEIDNPVVNLTQDIIRRYAPFVVKNSHGNNGETEVDVAEKDSRLLHALSRRVHTGGAMIARAKFNIHPNEITELAEAGRINELEAFLRDEKAEQRALVRIGDKASTLEKGPEESAMFYQQILFPLTLKSEALYLGKEWENLGKSLV